MCTKFLFGVMKMLWNQIAVMAAQLYEYTQSNWLVYLNVMAGELYLYKAFMFFFFFLKTTLAGGGGRVAAGRPGVPSRAPRWHLLNIRGRPEWANPIQEGPSLPFQGFCTLVLSTADILDR